MYKQSRLTRKTRSRKNSASPVLHAYHKTCTGKHTFQECSNPAEQLINVTVRVPHWEEVEVNLVEYNTVDQGLQVHKHVPILFSLRVQGKFSEKSEQTKNLENPLVEKVSEHTSTFGLRLEF